MEKRKRGRPRKNPLPEQSQDVVHEGVAQADPAPPVTGTAIQFNAALDQMALARDYASAIELGGLGPQDFAELAGEARKAICKAGERIERNLLKLGMLPEGEEGWFLDLKEVA